jgi:hypothetical protein
MTAKQYDPDKTKGARAARKCRERLNSASDKKRERLLQEGLAMIYGAAGEKVRCS